MGEYISEPTPEMIRAGVAVLDEMASVVSAAYLAAQVYKAMDRAKPSSGPQNPS